MKIIIPRKHNTEKNKDNQKPSPCMRKGTQPPLMHTKLAPVKAILFELGYALYDETQYNARAFKDISRFLSEKKGIDYDKTYSLIQRIWKIKANHYEYLLNDLLQILGVYSDELLQAILDVYHNSKPRLKPLKGIQQLLGKLGGKYKLVLLTDGYPKMQRSIVAALGFSKLFDKVIYVAEHNPPPEKSKLFAYRLVLDKMKLKPEQAVIVSDNPYEDFKGAKMIGINTIRVLQGEFKGIRLNEDFDADICLKCTLELKKLLIKYMPG